MQFSEVIGQKELKTQLTHMIQQNRLSHALLFLGKEGSGGLPLALAFAQYITCEKNPLQVSRKKNVPAAVSMFGEEEATEAESAMKMLAVKTIDILAKEPLRIYQKPEEDAGPLKTAIIKWLLKE